MSPNKYLLLTHREYALLKSLPHWVAPPIDYSIFNPVDTGQFWKVVFKEPINLETAFGLGAAVEIANEHQNS